MSSSLSVGSWTITVRGRPYFAIACSFAAIAGRRAA